jgi:hypothetical protein
MAKLRGTYYENTRLKGVSWGKAQASIFLFFLVIPFRLMGITSTGYYGKK